MPNNGLKLHNTSKLPLDAFSNMIAGVFTSIKQPKNAFKFSCRKSLNYN